MYESYVGRWSRQVAREFLAWLDLPADADWLDVGCGTGALTQTILAVAHPASVRGIDRSPDFIEFARLHTADPRASFAVGDAQALPEPDAVADVVVSGLALNFVPQPELAVAELARVTRPGGWVEFIESGMPRNTGPSFDLIFTWGAQTLARRGIDVGFSPRIPSLPRQAGLANVFGQEIALPIGAHGGRTGSMLATDLLNSIKSIGGFIVAAGVTTREQFDQTWATARADMETTTYRGTVPFYIAYGQRMP